MDVELEAQRSEFNRLIKEQDRFYYEAAYAAHMSEVAFYVMYTLCDTGGSLTQAQLCRQLYYSRQTVNSAVKKLEKDGFIHLFSDVGNGHRKHMTLTDTGDAYCRRYVVPLIEAELSALSTFTVKERALLLSLLQRQLQWLKEHTEHHDHQTV